MRRRTLLAALATGGLISVTGCSDLHGWDTSGDRTPPEYDALSAQRVYLAPGVELTLPTDVSHVDGGEQATVVVLPDTTDVSPDQGIDWLATGTAVAFIGSEGQATLVEWLESDAYAKRFDANGVAVSAPPPDFLVAVGVDQEYVSKHGFTWADTSDPDDGRYLMALEEALEDAENR